MLVKLVKSFHRPVGAVSSSLRRGGGMIKRVETRCAMFAGRTVDPKTCPPPTPLGSGPLTSATSACAGTWGWPRELKLTGQGKMAIMTAMHMFPTNSFEFRATGKCNSCLCRYIGMAKIAKTWCVGKGGHQDCYGHVPHKLLWVQGHWKVQHLPVQVHGDGQGS